ncbi:p24 [Hyphantria cunea granulovirus]|uniref:P24 n=1 Tax=Hyphantria cunea granulovirus TaxID=307448 RepID=A0AAF1D281_9BBAC|nr:p24 [Hyphantria cunea granulovirus]QBQ01615.1 p24 [Hyphantria cunea granulovirus]
MSFDYNSGPIEVFIVTNDEGTVNGYAEVSAVAQLLSPFTRVSSTQLWNSTPISYRIQNNNKNYIHAVVVCKYLSAIPESSGDPNYNNLRQLVRDLMVGDQKESDDIIKELLNEIKELKSIMSNDSLLSDLSGLLRIFKSEIVSEITNPQMLEKDDSNFVEVVVENK